MAPRGLTPFLAIAFTLVTASVAAAGQPLPAQGRVGVPGRYGQLPPPHLTSVGAVAPSRVGAVPAFSRPLLVRDRGLLERAKVAPISSVVRPASGTALRTSHAPTGAGTGLILMSHDNQTAITPSYDFTPPDTQVAAGPTALVEMVNVMGSIWSKSGALLGTPFDLQQFFGVPQGFGFFDPRILYDPSIGRWIASGASANSAFSSGEVYIAVSQSADPSPGNWKVYADTPGADSLLTNHACDQPKIGTSADKVGLSCQLYDSAARFAGELTFVFNKMELAGGALAPHFYERGPDLTIFGVVPSTALSYTSTLWMAYNLGQQPSGTTPFLGVISVSGDPARGTIAFQESDPSILGTHIPPSAQQPGVPAPPPIQTDDDRLLSAVWQGGTLWAAGNDACTPGGDSGTRACLRFFKVDTTLPGTPVTSTGYAIAQAYVYYPALTLDQAGNLFVAFSESSVADFPNALTAVLPVGGVSFESPTISQSGTGDYIQKQSVPAAGSRWGDYSAAAVDPCINGGVWLSGEYAETSGSGSNWGTATTMTARSGAPSTGPQWSGPGCLGGSLLAAPDAASWDLGRLDVFAAGPNHDLIHTWNDGSWHPWQSLGGYLSADPSAVSWSRGDGSHRLDVFVRGGDNALWHKWWDGTTWSAWQSLGGTLASGPDVASWASGRLDVFAVGNDRQLIHWWWDGLRWSGPQGLGGQLTADPGAASWGPNRIDVFGRGSDNQLWHKWWDGVGWSGWEPQGGLLAGGPDVSAWGRGRLDVVIQGTDQGLWHKSWDGSGWSGWEPHAAYLGSDPTVVSAAANRLDVFYRAPDGELMQATYK